MPASGPELGPEDFSSTAFSGGAGVEILGTSSRLLTDSKGPPRISRQKPLDIVAPEFVCPLSKGEP